MNRGSCDTKFHLCRSNQIHLVAIFTTRIQRRGGGGDSGSKASTYYGEGSMPLVFTQEDCLFIWIKLNISLKIFFIKCDFDMLCIVLIHIKYRNQTLRDLGSSYISWTKNNLGNWTFLNFLQQ